MTRTPSSRSRLLLLAGASALSLIAANAANAQTLAGLRGANATPYGGSASTGSAPTGAGMSTLPSVAQSALNRQNAIKARLATAQDLAGQAQAAARAAAGSVASGVPDGLAAGGLMPVANPTSAILDATGIATWDGASAPSQSSDGGSVNVTIHQNQSRAILSWQSFNVGKNTTLTFDQQGNPDWIVLNRVVDPTVRPSQIRGQIKADGTVLVMNRNGVVFTGTSQINTHSLIATSLEIGAATVTGGVGNPVQTLADRNQQFLADGLLGYSTVTFSPAPTQTVNGGNSSTLYSGSNGAVTVQGGAQITSGEGGYILLAAPVIENAGHLSATDGQVILSAGDEVDVTAVSGAADSIAPGVRGFVAIPSKLIAAQPHSVVNDTSGMIDSVRGSIFLGAAADGAAVNAGILSASTSVARNGVIEVSGSNIQLSPGSVIAITPDGDGSTIPQDPASVAGFQSSRVTIGYLNNRSSTLSDQAAQIDIEGNALVYAPSGDIAVGALADASNVVAHGAPSRVFVDSDAVIDAAGLADVAASASRSTLVIPTLKGNELAESPLLRNSFLNGQTIYLDPRLSGVRDDGVAWIGSPLVDAATYYQQIGISVSELMTKGGHVSLGTDSYSASSGPAAPNVIVKPGSTIDIAGGWVSYPAGLVQTSRLIDAYGRVVDIGQADPNDTYVGLYQGQVVVHPRWNVTETYTSSLLLPAGHYMPAYTEGRDAGTLSIKSSAVSFDADVFAQAFSGTLQISDAVVGTGTSTVFGDMRPVQATPSQLPAGGLFFIDGVSQITSSGASGAADILVQAASDHQALTSGLGYGQSLAVAADGSGSVTQPAMRDPASILSPAQMGVISLSDSLLSGSGFSQVSLHTSGAVKIAANARVAIDPGGVFDVLAGRTITVDGTVTVPSGTIALTTFDSRKASPGGSVFSNTAAGVGSFDIVVNGGLSTAGLWVNDFGLAPQDQSGAAWLNGGSISLYAAPRVASVPANPASPDAVSTDLSGSVLVNSGALLDVSGGGRIGHDGKFDLSAKGGNLALLAETSYFEISPWANMSGADGSLSGFRVHGLQYEGDSPVAYTPVNPDKINARVSVTPGSIRAQGFAGGGTFTLATPEFAFSDDTASSASAQATRLPLSFFSDAGFGSYDITSYKTALLANPFNNGLGGTDALLATQTLTVGQGKALDLTQSMLPSRLSVEQKTALAGLASGGSLFSVLAPAVPQTAWDRKAASLTLGGLLELHVDAGGAITGDAGAALTVSGLLNQGDIRLPGGSITQQTDLPTLYTAAGIKGVHALSDVFSVNPDGSITEGTQSKVAGLTNAQLAGAGSPNATANPIYLLGLLDAGTGIELASGSTTDLSGASILNPFATGPSGQPIVTGRMVDGGVLEAVSSTALSGQSLFRNAPGSPYQLLASEAPFSVAPGLVSTGMDVVRVGHGLVLDAGSTLNISGVSDVYDQPIDARTPTASRFVQTPMWSNAGVVSAGAGLTFAGGSIDAHGGGVGAAGGTLVALDPVLTQHEPSAATANLISADRLSASGFDTLVALGSVSNAGDVTVDLGRGFFLETRPVVNNGLTLTNVLNTAAGFVPTVRSTGGSLTIDAPYMAFDSTFDVVPAPTGPAGLGQVTFNATSIDFTGATLVDSSVANVTFNAIGDIRLTGVTPWKQTYFPNTPNVTPQLTLAGAVAGMGNLTFNAGQIYPTTGSSFSITSPGAQGSVTFGRTGADLPDAPYSAGGSLLVQAASIVQGGVLRAPMGSITLGGNAAYTPAGASGVFAPATQSLTLASGGLTSVSANGLDIPYGVTTDQTEWYFNPTNTSPLTSEPQKLITLAGQQVSVASGAAVDLSGGGDVYAYEFTPGVGGSRDVLNQLNPDPFTSANGYQYADKRQVYAIVPGVSDKPVAAYDPIYSANYAALSSATQAGKRVWLDGGPGLSAGWYTLLPAQYAFLPGGMRVVETGSSAAIGVRQTLADGSLVTTGRYGDALSGASQSQLRLFEVQSQSVINQESAITLTQGNAYFGTLAAHAGSTAPRSAADAGRLVLNPTSVLAIDPGARFSTAATPGGLGAQVDVAGAKIDILADLNNAPVDGAVHIAAASLSTLNADSLLIGGTRVDNGDGTTTLDVTATNILVQNSAATPLSAGEIVLASSQGLTVSDGAAITAVGQLSDTRTGAYELGEDAGPGTGALLRVANGPERLTKRTGASTSAALAVGAATLSGTSIMFDSSGSDSLSSNLSLQNAQFIALGAPRIGFGADPATYQGLVVTSGLERLLTQGGARLTLRSQSSIDFADGDYDFGAIRLDAAALSSLGGGNVNVSADTISLGNVGAADTVCALCTAGGGTLTLQANRVVFTGGAMTTQASILASSTQAVLARDVTVTLPAGTHFTSSDGTAVTLQQPLQVIVPAGVAITLPAGVGVLPGLAASTVSGASVALTQASIMLPPGNYYAPNVAAGVTVGLGSIATAAAVTLPAGVQAVLASAPVATQFFGGGVTLTARNGMSVQGSGSLLDTGLAPLAVHAPQLTDEKTTAGGIPDLTLVTRAALTVDNAGSGAAAATVGVPGAAITLSGQSVSISGTDLHATAGAVNVFAQTGITLSNGARIEAPGYQAAFGDSADPASQNAPGGSVTLTTAAGDILLGDGSLSVGGGAGEAGALSLSAPQGRIDLAAAMLDGTGGSGGAGGRFSLDAAGGVDLAALNARVGADGFTAGFSVHTATGDLVLASGQTLRSGAVNLTADGGTVDIGGVIYTSGVNGGDVSLYGRSGVTLESGSRIDASAAGYAATDTRQAKGGNVTLGTDFTSSAINADGSVSGASGTVTVAAGAVIDVSAKRPGDRLVPSLANGTAYYSYAEGDQGGTLTLRAPLTGPSGSPSVNVTVADAGSVVGAREVDLVGVKRWDLGAVADSNLYSGVVRAGSTVTLNAATGLDTANADGSMTTVSGINFLGDKGTAGAPTLVDFVQTFSLSSAAAQLGGLASQANFHARPGIDLDYSGAVVLASNWNLGAGVVNQTAALSAGAMRTDPILGKPVTLIGQEANLLANFTTLTYRTNHGSPTGEAPVLSLRAGDQLDLKGSITDGFFQFRDQTDPTYLSEVGVTNSTDRLTFNAGYGGCTVVGAAQCAPTNVSTWGIFSAAPAAFFGLGLSVPTAASYVSTGSSALTLAPYSAIANSPAALGSFTQGSGAGTSSVANGGDPLGSAVVFPLLPGGRVAQSSSYDLVAGADLSSADPRRASPGTSANLVVEGSSSAYTYARASSSAVHQADLLVDTSPLYATTAPAATNPALSLPDWLAQFSTNFSGLDPNAIAFLNWGTNVVSGPQITLLYGTSTTLAAPAATSLLGQFIANNHLVAGTAIVAGDYRLIGTIKNGVYMKVSTLKLFIQQMLIPNMAQIESIYSTKANNSTPTLGTAVTAQSGHTLVRTGTGDIGVTASGAVDLTNGPLAFQSNYQLGGTSIYTAGHPADTTTPRTATDVSTGQVLTITLPAAATSNLANASTYTYGASSSTISTPGILIADPVYAEGGGNVAVSAGGDILGRRDSYLSAVSATGTGGAGSATAWMGGPAQPWRSGLVGIGGQTFAAIDPQLFQDGVGALGGGDIRISAGGNVSDLAAIASNSMMTGTASGGGSAQTLLAFGSGDVDISARGDILGGRIDVASGTGQISAGGSLSAAGQAAQILTTSHGIGTTAPLIPNALMVRVGDGAVSVSARGGIDIQGVASLAPQSRDSANGVKSTLDALGFYSSNAGLSLIGNGAVTVENQNDDSLSPAVNGLVNAVYPGSFKAASLTGDLNLVTGHAGPIAASILLAPSPVGQLELFAGSDIAATSLAMLDADPGVLPGPFSVNTGTWAFPAVFPDSTDAQRRLLHNPNATHAGDPDPIRIYAGEDIGSADGGLLLSAPKQARIGAGRDIVNMMFFGQNLATSDVTRITAGRDITATTVTTAPRVGSSFGAAEAALQGNTFVIGGPGTFMLEAGRDLGPFLNSASVTSVRAGGATKVQETYGGGVMSVGAEWNPWLPAQGAALDVMFGVAGGANYDALRETYVDPANQAAMPDYLFEQTTSELVSGGVTNDLSIADRSRPIYGEMLVSWMQGNDATGLQAAYGTTQVTSAQAYAVFTRLPELNQRVFLNQVYFNELKQTSVPDGLSYLKYSRSYQAVNILFPASAGYTQNSLDGGSNGANNTVQTGNLDLRLATIQTAWGGGIDILGPGGRVLGGSTVRTAAQAARRTYDGSRLYNGYDDLALYTNGGDAAASAPVAIDSIPPGYEGVLTLRGGDVNTFTDGDFLLNQSRLFTEQGGDIVMWSSNANLNAGQGPKTSANFPPVLVKSSPDLYAQTDQAGATTGAGIAALQATPQSPPSDVFLIAPRGTVDAGDAGIRASGNLSIAALAIANADNIQVQGKSFGIPTGPAIDVSANLGASTSAAAAAEAAVQAVQQARRSDRQSIITVTVDGFGPTGSDCPAEAASCRAR